jgi:hypothetical protein
MHVSPSWEANGRSASQEIPYLVWNTEVHCRVYNIPPLAPNLNQINAVHTFPPYLSKISSALILQSVPVSSAWPFLLRFSDHNFVCISHLFRLCYMRRPSHPPWFDNPSIWWSVQVMKLLITPSSHSFLRPRYSFHRPVLRHSQSERYNVYVWDNKRNAFHVKQYHNRQSIRFSYRSRASITVETLFA